MRKRWWLIGVVVVASAIIAGIFALSGPFSYVSTRGVSMAPSFQQGDLVLIRSADTYQVGDVVAYHSQLLDTVVMHRIIERDGDHYLFKGDNNSWIDRDEPTRAELIGTSWLRVPHVGSALSWLRSSWALFPPIALVIAGLVPTRKHRRRNLGADVRSSRTATPSPRTGRVLQQLLPAAAAGLMAFVALGVVAYTRPITQPQPSTVDYIQQGGFSYSATTPTGPVYGTEGVTTGDPLFLQLVTEADVRFTYQFESPAPAEVTGTVSLTADLSDPTGWNRSLELSPPTEFSGNKTEARATLDVARLQTMIEEVESLTGTKSGTHTVSIAAHVQIAGTVAGQTLQETFGPSLVFQLDTLQLRPTWTAGSTTDQDPLAPSEPGSVTTTSSDAGQLSALGRHLAVSQARNLAMAGALASTIALVVCLVALRPQRRDENARIHAKHGHRIIPVDAADGDGTLPVVDVTTMADLARLAEQYGCLILHQTRDSTHSYSFQADRTIYRYRIRKLEPIASWPAPLSKPPDSYEVTARPTGAALQR